MYIFLSPHFDDAIGSAGGAIARLIASGKKVQIITIMAKAPQNRVKDFIYVVRRVIENKLAARVLGAGVKNAPFYDAIYRKNQSGKKLYLKKDLFKAPLKEDRLISDITKYILDNSKEDDTIFAPAGLGGHIDHRIVRNAAEKTGRKIRIYQEFFYDKTDVDDALTQDLDTLFLKPEELSLKIKSLKKYKKTMRKLFGKNSKEKLYDYFLNFRVQNGLGFEKFNKIDFIK